MLCDICQVIFSDPRRITCGTYYPCGHTNTTFVAAREAGCHICNLVWGNASYGRYDPKYDGDFPDGCTFAFRVLSPEWARHGNDPKWIVPNSSRDDDEFSGEYEAARYLREMDNHPIVNQVASLLTAECNDVLQNPMDFWLVLDFSCPGPRIVLPLEIVRASPVLRLVSSSSLPRQLPYATLSHRWGKTNDYTLTSNLLSAYETEIPICGVSATLRDAFHATRSIGLEYLWIDTMCIMQDDPDDWIRESATMSKVYGLCTCTLVAAVSADRDGDDGCFVNRNQYTMRPCLVPNPFIKDSKLSFYVRSQFLSEIYKREVKDSAWYNRGWVFQERSLSPSLLIFGRTQMLWACTKLEAAETWPCGKTGDDFIDRFESFRIEKSRLRTLLDKERVISHFNTAWSTFIQDYIRSNLTRLSHRLIALQGLASQIEAETGRQYCAGLWIDSTLPSSLLWCAGTPKLPQPQKYRAPTWSWASIDGPVDFNYRRTGDIKIKVLATISLPIHREQLPKVRLAGLSISGSLLPATLVTPYGDDPGELIMRPKIQSGAVWQVQQRVRGWYRETKFHLDAPLAWHGSDEISVVCLLITSSKVGVFRDCHGLVLQPVEGRANQYERLGLFNVFVGASSLPLLRRVFTLV